MKTFGELVTQIKRGLLELCNDLMGPGAAQTLGPAHAYGKSFLILQSLRTLQDAIQKQETHLHALIGKEGASGTAQANDTKTWRVVDSIHQSLSLIERYMQDPSRYTHHGIAEWLKQEASSCGLGSEISPNPNGGEDLYITGKDANSFLLELSLEDKEKIANATLTLQMPDGSSRTYDCPEIVEFLERDMRSHISHLFSMAARLDVIEKETPDSPLPDFTIPDCPIEFKMSLGGLRFPFVEGFEAILTYDWFEQSHRMPMIVIDPPIIFPFHQLEEIKDLCSARFNIEFLASSTISQMIDLKKDVFRMIGDIPVRLILNDSDARNGSNVHSIKLARLPLGIPSEFMHIITILKKAAMWCSIIKDAFSVTEEVTNNMAMVDIAPKNDFSLVANYWVGERPAHIVITVNDDGTLQTDNESINECLTPESTFFDIIHNIIE